MLCTRERENFVLIPDHETAVDFLNYEAISGTVVELLKDNRQRALTIGIHGDWGAGKSSVLKMIESAMAEDEKVACLWFNGWAFQGFDDAKTVLIEATLAELSRQRSGIGRVKEVSAGLIKRIDWLKLARRGGSLAFTLATGVPSPDLISETVGGLQQLAGNVGSMSPADIEAKLNEATSYLKPGDERSVPEEIHQFRKEFLELLDEAKIDQLVVLVDDLDRCLPATAIDTLEAIRLFLFVPKTAFVVGADEGMIEYAVRQHFPNLPLVSGPIPYARHYLEKLIQVPFRIPALGVQEARTYVTLLLVEALVGEGHEGFNTLLAKARKSLNKPWLGVGISQTDVCAVDPVRQDQLNAAFLLAQQTGPILAEGTEGNPRQIKRFLNSLFIRLSIAEARGFIDRVNQTVLAKLMLAERFQQDFYEHLAAAAMRADDGKVVELRDLEGVVREDGRSGFAASSKKAKAKKPAVRLDASTEKWLEREWLRRWLALTPTLGTIDLRPYVFVAGDKRILSAAGKASDLDSLIELLTGSEMAARSVEPQVKALTQGDAEQAFGALRERAVSEGSFSTQPPGFEGLMLVAKHHPRYQAELLGLVGSIEPKMVGFWVVKGWNEILSDSLALEQYRTLLVRWAAQDDNATLKKGASQALSTQKVAR